MSGFFLGITRQKKRAALFAPIFLLKNKKDFHCYP